ncbi:hypothetical protein ACWD3J_14095 [Streptomyces sp. NPDC002755]
MRTDDLLAQIDSTLHDWAVSDDAMRSRPEPEPITFGGGMPTVAIMDELGAWQELGVSAVEIRIEAPAIDPDFELAWQEVQEWIARVHTERVQRVQVAVDAFQQAFDQVVAPGIREAVQETARSLAQLANAVQHPSSCDHHRPARRSDRPAWQSPYGPPWRRR